MAATYSYEGKIRLKSGGNPVPVRTEAGSTSQAKKIIEAQFAGQIKAWSVGPRRVSK